MAHRSGFSRRRLLHGAGLLALGGVAATAVAACGGASDGDRASSAFGTRRSDRAPLPATIGTATDGNDLRQVAARIREAQGDIGIQPPPPADVGSVTDLVVAGGALMVPADVVAARQSRLVSAEGRDDQIRFWRNIGWDTNFDISLVPFEEILSGGVPRDGIPPIDKPKFVGFDDADIWVAGRQPVIALEHNGVSRAYPLQIMTFHEIANDVIGGTPVAITFCPLCNSSIVFDRTVFGATLRFGVSGNLRNSDLIMWDDLTETWWQQLTGEGIVGDLAGVQLPFLPSQLLSYDEYKEAFPAGEVLSPDTGFIRNYGRNPYSGYDSIDDRPFLFRGDVDGRLRATERVVAVDLGSEAAAYPFSELRKVRVVNDTVGGEPVVVFWTPETASALGASKIAEAEAVGTGVAYSRLVAGRELDFAFVDGVFRDRETGTTWNVAGKATAGELVGSSLAPVIHANHFWFAWAAFKPETRIYRAS